MQVPDDERANFIIVPEWSKDIEDKGTLSLLADALLQLVPAGTEDLTALSSSIEAVASGSKPLPAKAAPAAKAAKATEPAAAAASVKDDKPAECAEEKGDDISNLLSGLKVAEA